MTAQPIKLNEAQHQELQEIAKALNSHYPIEKIICFAAFRSYSSRNTVFASPETTVSNIYYLLVLTTDLTRIEYAMQDYITNLFPGTLVIAHGQETVMNLFNEYNRFFLNACLNGVLIYTADGFTMTPEFEKEKVAQKIVEDRDAFGQIYRLAAGFMECGFDCYGRGLYNHVAFVLHQAVEQGCRAMIRLFTGYHSDIHNIARLLNFCSCFSPEPAALFPRHHEKEKQLFRVLATSYSEARYRDNFQVSKHDANELCSLVKSFLNLVEELALKQIHTTTAMST